MQRRAFPAGIAIAVVLAVAGCTVTPAKPADLKATPVGVLPADAAVHPVQAVTATVAPAIAKKTDLIFGAGYESGLDDRAQATLPTRTNTAALLTVVDAQNHVLARAITVRLAGFNPAPVPVDYTSTAFTRLATTPPFLTDDPLSLVILRAAAGQSPHLNALGAAMSAHAAKDSNYLATPTATESAEVSALTRDVNSTLKVWADNVTESAAVTSNSAMPQALLSKTAAEAPTGCGEGMDSSPATGICMSNRKDTHGDYVVKSINISSSWAFVYASDDPTLPVGAIRPRTFTLPTMSIIRDALFKDGLRGAGYLAATLCAHLPLVGDRCKKAQDSLDPFKNLKDLANSVNQNGEGDFVLTTKRAAKKSYVVTVGAKQGPTELLPTETQLESAQATLALMTSWTQIGQPLLNLLEGTGEHEEPVAPSKMKTSIKELESAIADANAQALTLKFVNMLRDGNYSEAMTAMIGIAKILVDQRSSALLTTLFKLVAPSLGAAKVIKGVLQRLIKYGADLIPGPGWVKAIGDVADITALGSNMAMGVILITKGLAPFANVGAYEPINPDLPAAAPQEPTTPSSAPAASPLSGTTQFGYIEGLVKRPSDWVLRFDRAYLCFGNSHDEAGCDNPTRATLDDGSWIINNNPAKVEVPASNSIDIELFNTNTMKHYRQELPTILDMKGGIHWESAASPVGPAAYLTFNAQGSVVKMTEYFMP